jgi:cathepsin X
LLNCNGGGTCEGGDPIQAYNYIAEYGIPDSTCLNYLGESFGNCSEIN